MTIGTILPLYVAFILDLFVGDPPRWPHPIRWMGKGIDILEPISRRFPIPLVLSGAAMTLFLVGAAYLLTLGLIYLAGFFSPILKIIVTTLLIFYSISIKSLHQSALTVFTALSQGDLIKAREQVGQIVGRDTDHLTQGEVRRATIETVAENFVDGVAAPLFYTAIGGAPLAMAYKMINTLDSMIGYKNEHYHQFGKAAARLDDGANFLPARLAVPVIALAAQLVGKTGHNAWSTALSEGTNHSSPNAGYPEAAFAGALGVRLNGPAHYGGIRVEKPFIGTAYGPAANEDIKRACDLMVLSSLLWLVVVIVFTLVLP